MEGRLGAQLAARRSGRLRRQPAPPVGLCPRAPVNACASGCFYRQGLRVGHALREQSCQNCRRAKLQFWHRRAVPHHCVVLNHRHRALHARPLVAATQSRPLSCEGRHDAIHHGARVGSPSAFDAGLGRDYLLVDRKSLEVRHRLGRPSLTAD